MAVSFNNIPGNLRVPLAYFEIDPSQAASYQQATYALLLGTHAPARGPLQLNRLTLIRSRLDAEGQAGIGSALARMADMYFRNNQSVPLYVIAAPETTFAAGVGLVAVTVATGAGGPATESGTISLYIGGRLVRAYVRRGMDDEEIATALVEAINADPSIGVEAELRDYDAGPPIVPWGVTITAIQPGVIGALDIQVNFRGPAFGEVTPTGVTLAVTQMAGATGVPDVAALLGNLGDELLDHIACPWADAASLDDVDEYLNDITGRWSWSQQLYGHAYSHMAGNLGALAAFGVTRNGHHATLSGMDGSPTAPCEIVAAWTGQCAGSEVVDPARPVQSLPLLGVMAPPPERRFTILDRQTLLFDGIATTYVDAGGVVRIDRSITTYQRNVWGAPDNSYLDVETLWTIAYFNRFNRQRIMTKFPRHKLADDGTRFGAGQAIVTPAIVRAEMVAVYGELEEAGIVENIDAYRAALIVERNAQDPNRLDALLPPDVVNQLRIFAALVQFRLRSVSTEA